MTPYLVCFTRHQGKRPEYWGMDTIQHFHRNPIIGRLGGEVLWIQTYSLHRINEQVYLCLRLIIITCSQKVRAMKSKLGFLIITNGITIVLLIERFWDGSNQIQTMRFKNVNYWTIYGGMMSKLRLFQKTTMYVIIIIILL